MTVEIQFPMIFSRVNSKRRRGQVVATRAVEQNTFQKTKIYCSFYLPLNSFIEVPVTYITNRIMTRNKMYPYST